MAAHDMRPAQVRQVYDRFLSQTDTVNQFIEHTSRILHSRQQAIRLAQRMTTIACIPVSRQDERISQMLDTIHASSNLRKAVHNTAQHLKTPPEAHEQAAARLVPELAHFTKPIDQQDNPLPPQHPHRRAAIEGLSRLHNNYLRSIAATIVNYAVMDQEDRQEFIDDMTQHLQHRNEALLLLAQVCRAVMHMRFPTMTSRELVTALNRAEHLSLPANYRPSDPRQNNERRHIASQMTAFAASLLAEHCASALNGPTLARNQHLEAANFWQQVTLNIPTS